MTMLCSNVYCLARYLQSIPSSRGNDHDEHVNCIVDLNLWLAETYTLYNHYIVSSWVIEEIGKEKDE